jgi:hypothetical protein
MLARIRPILRIQQYVRPAASVHVHSIWRGYADAGARDAVAHRDLEAESTSDVTLSHGTNSQKTQHSPRPPLQSLLPPPPSSHHNSQTEFLAYARRTGLNPATAVYLGTRYEYLVLSSLRRLGIELARFGGKGDKGVDLVGWWHLPQWRKPSSQDSFRGDNGSDGGEVMKVLVQCKRIDSSSRSDKRVSPAVVRELEGAIRGAPAGWRKASEVLMMLISTRPTTKGVMDEFKRSERPLVWVLLEEAGAEGAEGLYTEEQGEREAIEEESRDVGDEIGETDARYSFITGRIRQIFWNQKAKELGLEGLDVVKRYASDDRKDMVSLMWKGKPVEELPFMKQ